MRMRKGVGEMNTDNRTNGPTDEQVEAAAEAIYFEDCGVTPDESIKATDDYGSTFRELARAVLVAAAGVAPVQPSSTVDEATVNLNMWHLYRPGDPALTYNLLEYIREGEVL